MEEFTAKKILLILHFFLKIGTSVKQSVANLVEAIHTNWIGIGFEFEQSDSHLCSCFSFSFNILLNWLTFKQCCKWFSPLSLWLALFNLIKLLPGKKAHSIYWQKNSSENWLNFGYSLHTQKKNRETNTQIIDKSRHFSVHIVN